MTTSPFPNSEIKTHGLSPVPRSFHALLSPAENPDYNPSLTPGPYSPLSSSNAPPSTSLATVVNQYARQHLSEPTYNHSFRVYHYGRAIQTQHFHSQGSWSFSPETYFLACLLHDIGTTSENLRRTALSFEFWGGVEALRVLEGAGAGLVQRESVAEAVVRHQDLGEEGKIGAVGALLQIATVLGECVPSILVLLFCSAFPFFLIKGMQLHSLVLG